MFGFDQQAQAAAIIDEGRQWLAESADDYKEFKQSFEDISWCQDALRACHLTLLTLEAYDPKADRPEAGIHAVGAAVTSLRSILHAVEFIDIFEERRSSINAIHNQQASQED